MKSETKFYIVDFDRTLADSDKLIEIFMEIADKYFQIPKQQIEQVDREVKQRGDTFFLASYVRDHLKEEDRLDDWQKMEKMFIHESRALNYLLPGANELLDWLLVNKQRFGILTYGDPFWQKLKLSASGFNHVPRIIMEQKEKGRLIGTWQQEDGTFLLPQEFGGGNADAVVLIDDKAVSFQNFPPLPSYGYWVLNPERELLSQKGSVPENVKRFNDLFAVVNDLEQ